MGRELDIKYMKLNFFLQVNQDCTIPEFKMSAIRGGIGDMLLADYCIRDGKCECCDFKSECIVQRTMYSHFEKKPEYVTIGESIGYVIECDNDKTTFKEGDKFSFSLILFGNTCIYLPSLIRAVNEFGSIGLGASRAKYTLITVTNELGEIIWNTSGINREAIGIRKVSDYLEERRKALQGHGGTFQLDFQTPLTMKYERQYLSSFEINAIIRGVQRRINILDFYENIDGESAYKNRIYSSCMKSQHAYPVSQKRYSNRKNQTMWLKGIKGTLYLEDVPDEVLDLLIVGELIHVGKNTSFGFGKYVIR